MTLLTDREITANDISVSRAADLIGSSTQILEGWLEENGYQMTASYGRSFITVDLFKQLFHRYANYELEEVYTPAQLARVLNVDTSVIYYHIRKTPDIPHIFFDGTSTNLNRYYIAQEDIQVWEDILNPLRKGLKRLLEEYTFEEISDELASLSNEQLAEERT